jgi:hypothetical protein
MTAYCPGAGLREGDRIERSRLDRHFASFARPWLHRAERARAENEPFEALIYLWVTFNAWASQVVSNRDRTEEDAYLIQVAARDERLCDRFTNLTDRDQTWRGQLNRFHGLWPIFKSRTLVEQGLGAWEEGGATETRAQYRERVFAAGLRPRDYAPRCFLEHQAGGVVDPAAVPLDWPHALSAIYQVRCNLFHGGKSFIYGRDQDFATLAYDVLHGVWAPVGVRD